MANRARSGSPGALSIRTKIPEIPGGGANGTLAGIFRKFIPKFLVYPGRLDSPQSLSSSAPAGATAERPVPRRAQTTPRFLTLATSQLCVSL